MKLLRPEPFPQKSFTDPLKAWEYLDEIYRRNTAFIRDHFTALVRGTAPMGKVRACYPQIQVSANSYHSATSSMPFGFLHSPGVYRTTVTSTELFRDYLITQLSLVIKNHGCSIEVGESTTPIPLHFAANGSDELDHIAAGTADLPLRDLFDSPDLGHMDDEISNGTLIPPEGGPYPLAAFTAPRVDYSLHRLNHYTATDPEHFQNFVIFTNYQFYIDEFCRLARQFMAEGHPVYDSFTEPGNAVTYNARLGGKVEGTPAKRSPQMPAYHLASKGNRG
ncbi:MAG TPA: AMP nucleosidase, partial [Devosia sp.]|nr:AMP nucleosidase [Devosia sp.]